ncbi:MAG: hypothetical protein WBB07_09235 [Mycobacterium sp.]
MNWDGRRVLRAISAVIGTTVVVGFCAPHATAEPGEGGLTADSPILSLDALGSDSTIPFYGAQGITSLTLPVPQGLTPASLDVVVEVPVNMARGTLTVMQEDRALARVPLSVDDRVPLSIPLTGVMVADNAVTVTLRSYLVPIEGYCLDPSNPLRLVNANIRYEGVEIAPRTVADFLPPVLQQLDLFLPDEPTRAESDAALRLSTAIVARYGQQNTLVTLTAMADGQEVPAGPSLPFQRRVVIREGNDTGVRLTDGPGVPTLLITGPAEELGNQARLLASDLGRLALSSSAVVGPLRPRPLLPPDVTALRDLGQQGVTAVALAPQVNIALDQTRLGRAAHNMRVHLLGSYTPLPSTVGGQLVANVGGQTIDRWQVDSTGVIDRWVTVPDRLLQRYTNLGVALNITGNTGQCGEFQPITLTIDGDSPVQSTRANPPVPAGFQSLPQALMPRVEVGISDDFDDTRRAVAILAGLQRLSALPIDTAVVSVEEALASQNPAVVVEAASWTHEDVTLPVAGNTDGVITVENVNGDGDVDGGGETGTLTLDPSVSFGSLQVVYTNNRSVLVATSNSAPAQLDQLLNWLDTDPERWARLRGDALIAAPDRTPVVVSTGAQESRPAETGSAGPRLTTLWAGVAVTSVAAVALLGALLIARRRRT